ncbi:MAG TPA: M28 family metallopeptidase [Pyrinomonadaceae bacterium]
MNEARSEIIDHIQMPTLYPIKRRPDGQTTLRSSFGLFLVLAIPLLFIACPRNDPKTDRNVGVSMSTPNQTPTPFPGTVAFNGERAMDHVRKQLDFGPRPPGTPELGKTRDYIVNELKTSGVSVSTDEFTATTPVGERRMINVIGEIAGESKTIIIISSHYDTKLYKDMKFLGANDPAASVAALLELGRVLGANKGKLKATYRLVFFDGEEAFCEGWDDCGKPDAPDNTYGSRHYVAQLKSKKELELVKAMILLDMMGYRDLKLGRDTMSTRWLQDIVWQTGKDIGYGSVFVDEPEGVGGDDHEPFLRAGIDSVDLIQLNGYPYWHKADDTLDKVSARSIKIVGDVVLASLPSLEGRVLNK